MKIDRRIVPSVLAVIAATSLSAAAPAEATLTLTRERTYPGMSVPLTVRIRTETQPVRLTGTVRLRIDSGSGDFRFATWGNGRDFGSLRGSDDETLELPANSVRDLVIPAVDLGESSWSWDRELLNRPGKYRIQVLMYAAPAGEDSQSVEPIQSSIASLEILSPRPEDLAIWDALKNSKHRLIAAEAISRRPTSEYAPYLAPLATFSDKQYSIQPLLQAVRAHPTSPVVPWLRLLIARSFEHQAQEVFDRTSDTSAALLLFERARVALVELERHSDAWSRETAKRRLSEIPKRADLEALLAVRTAQ
jgi:hypothetical protein